MRFATYNIRHGAAPGARSNLRSTVDALASLRSEVIAIQEVDRRVIRSCFVDQAAELGRSLGMHSEFGSARRLGPFSGYGNALLTAEKLIDVDVVKLRSIGEQRVAIFGEVNTSIGRVTVACTHLQNQRAGRPIEAPEQLKELLQILSERAEPWVLMGDLNLRPEVVQPLLADFGLTSANSSPTFPAENPRLRIDWIAVRGLEIRRVETPALLASDHRPIVVELGAGWSPEFSSQPDVPKVP